MFSERQASELVDQGVAALSMVVQRFVDSLEKGMLFHEVVESAAEVGQAVSRSLVTLCAEEVNRLFRRSTPHCQKCRRRMRWTRNVEIQPMTSVGLVSIRRAHYQCKRCLGAGRYPFDERLALPGQVCESAMREGALLAAFMPFERAAETLKTLKNVDISAATCRRRTMELAHELVAKQDAGVERLLGSEQARKAASARADKPHRLYIAADGAKAHVRSEGWKEIRIGVLWSESEEDVKAKLSGKRSATRPSPRYVVRFRDVDEFSKALYGAALEAGIDNADEVVFLGDGAPWIWRIVDDWFPRATKILDWWHVIERLAEVVRLSYGESESRAGQQWLGRRKDNLSEGRPRLVVRALRWLRRNRSLSKDAAEAVRLAIGYCTTYQDQMDYQSLRERGCDIGSGRVEAGCKRIVAARLKACGCRWNQDNAEALAVLRAEALSGRLDLFWESRDNAMRALAAKRGPRKPSSRAA